MCILIPVHTEAVCSGLMYIQERSLPHLAPETPSKNGRTGQGGEATTYRYQRAFPNQLERAAAKCDHAVVAYPRGSHGLLRPLGRLP
jgi:hypothetical protein